MDNLISMKIKSMCGLKRLGLIIEPIPLVAEIDGLTTTMVRCEIIRKLHQAHIKVSAIECMENPGSPFLYVNVNLLKTHIGLYAYSSRVALKQALYLLRKPSQELYAITWETAQVGTVGVNRITTLVEKVGEQIDEFIADYLAANPAREKTLALMPSRKRAQLPQLVRHSLEAGLIV